MRARLPSKPSPRSRKSGKGLLDQGGAVKEGAFGALRDWLLRDEEATKGLSRAREDLGEGQGRSEGSEGGKDLGGRLPKWQGRKKY